MKDLKSIRISKKEQQKINGGWPSCWAVDPSWARQWCGNTFGFAAPSSEPCNC